MKQLLITIGLMAAYTVSMAQEKILLTAKGAWTTHSEQATTYALVYPKEKKLIKVEEFTLSGQKKAVWHYSKYKEDRRERIKHGLHISYYTNGQDSVVEHFADNKKEGLSQTYFPDGTLRFKCYFKNGKLDGEFLQYYRDGVLRRTENYENGQCTGGRLFNRQSEEIEHQPYQILPEFAEGGLEGLTQLIANVVKYPPRAQKLKLEGKAIVQFIVDQEGQMVHPKVTNKVDPDFEAEALRAFNAIAAVYRWKPGYIDGKPKKVKFNVPILFRLNR